MSGASGVLYHHCFSPPSRMALLTIRNLGLNIQIKNIDIYKGEQNSPQYLKINPLNQVPAYVEGNFLLAESKAIATYLANSSKSFLYPTDCKKRALIDAKLYYDTANSFPAVRNFVVTQISIKPIVNKTYLWNFPATSASIRRQDNRPADTWRCVCDTRKTQFVSREVRMVCWRWTVVGWHRLPLKCWNHKSLFFFW